MIERIHEHIIQELQQNARAETVFVVMAILLNFITMGVNASLATSASTTALSVLFITMALVVVVNGVAIAGLRKGRETKSTLLRGLMRMYRDQQVDQYYPSPLLEAYGARYQLLLVAVVATGVASFLIPLIILLAD